VVDGQSVYGYGGQGYIGGPSSYIGSAGYNRDAAPSSSYGQQILTPSVGSVPVWCHQGGGSSYLPPEPPRREFDAARPATAPVVDSTPSLRCSVYKSLNNEDRKRGHPCEKLEFPGHLELL
jgi:hypothetical protein